MTSKELKGCITYSLTYISLLDSIFLLQSRIILLKDRLFLLYCVLFYVPFRESLQPITVKLNWREGEASRVSDDFQFDDMEGEECYAMLDNVRTTHPHRFFYHTTHPITFFLVLF
jgi:hypothetical protein